MRHDKEVDKAIEERFGKLARMLPDEKRSKGSYEKSLRTGPNGDILESPRANPDVLSDEKGNRPLPESQHSKDKQRMIHDNKLYAIKNCKLSDQQCSILELVGRGFTHKEIARQLNSTEAAIQRSFHRARKHIESFYKNTRLVSEKEQ